MTEKEVLAAMSQVESLIESFDIDGMQRILTSLANEDAIKVFLAAKEGIRKSTRAIKELGLTQRRYYARLNELIKTGLIERRDDVYQLTTLGTVCYGLGEIFNQTLSHRDRLELVDRLRKTKSLSAEESRLILQTISSKGIIGYLGTGDLIQPVKLIEDFETLVSELESLINKSQKSIYLASYYHDSRVMEAILRAIQRDVKFSLLTCDANTSEKLQMLRMILTPEIVKSLLDFINKEEVGVRSAEIPFSFCIIDERFILIELPSPQVKTFYVGFSLQNEALSQRLIKTFEDLYRSGKDDPFVAFLKKAVTSPVAKATSEILKMF